MATTNRTQMRLSQISGSFGTASGTVLTGVHINDRLAAAASGSILAADAVDLFSYLASSIKRIHGGTDFSNQVAGEFTHSITPATADAAALGSAAKEWSDIFLADGAVLNFGNGQDTTLTHIVASDSLRLGAARKLEFGDAGTFIHQSGDGVLTIESDTTVDINGAVVFNGALSGISTIGASGVVTADGLTVGTAVLNATDLEQIDDIVPGTTAASKAMVTDASGDILMPDSDKFELGADSDMQLYHDGTNSYIANKTGALKVATETSGIAVTIGHGTSEVTVADNLTVAGNLTVTGTTITDSVEVISTSSGVLFEGGTDDGHEATLKSIVAGADVTYTLPNLTGHVPLLADTATAGSAAVTAVEMALLDGGSTVDNSVAPADGDGVLFNDGGVMKQVDVRALAGYFDDEITAMPNLVTTAATTVGALDAGSITSGFTSIDVGAGAISTTGTLTGGVLAVDDVNINGKVISMVGSTSDTVTMTAATNGAFSLVTVDDNAAAANIQITADGTVDIDSAGALTLDSGAAINLEPAAGSVILLDNTISVDAGVVTGATSITSTDLIGTNIDGIIGADTARAGTFAAVVGTTGVYSGILKTNDTTPATSITDGSLQTDGGLSVTFDAVIGDDLIMISDGAIAHFGADSEIKLAHVHDTGLLLTDTGGSPTLQFHDSAESVSSDGAKLILTSNGVAFSMPTADATSSGHHLVSNGAGVLSFETAGTVVTDRQKIVSGSAVGTVVSGSALRSATGLGEFNININTLTVSSAELRESMTLFVNGQLMLSGTVAQVGTGGADYHITAGSSGNHVTPVLGFDLLLDDTVHAVIR